MRARALRAIIVRQRAGSLLPESQPDHRQQILHCEWLSQRGTRQGGRCGRHKHSGFFRALGLDRLSEFQTIHATDIGHDHAYVLPVIPPQLQGFSVVGSVENREALLEQKAADGIAPLAERFSREWLWEEWNRRIKPLIRVRRHEHHHVDGKD